MKTPEDFQSDVFTNMNSKKTMARTIPDLRR